MEAESKLWWVELWMGVKKWNCEEQTDSQKMAAGGLKESLFGE